MRPTLFVLLALGLIAACGAVADEEYEYDDEPAPPPSTPAPARPAGRLGLLSPRARSPAVSPRKPAPATTTTAKPVEPQVEAEDGAEEEFEDSQEQQEAQTTTTESPKKLNAGGIRPFRSNEDLLAALKRRRAQAGVSTHAPSTTQPSVDHTTHKSKHASGGRSRNTEASKPSTRGRYGAPRGNKPVQEEVEETQQEEVQVKPKPYRRG